MTTTNTTPEGIDLDTLEALARQGAYMTRAEKLELITLARAAQPAHPVAAWMTEDGERVVPAATMEGARRDGGAMLSTMRPYTVALVRAAQPAPAVSEQSGNPGAFEFVSEQADERALPQAAFPAGRHAVVLAEDCYTADQMRAYARAAIAHGASSAPAEWARNEKHHGVSDIITAAGLLSHGRTDKKLARRIADLAWKLNAELHATSAATPASAPQAQVQRAANGWRLVPPKPTPEMLKAAQPTWSCTPGFDIEAIYSGMLAAAPQPIPAQPGMQTSARPALSIETLWEIYGVVKNSGAAHLAHKIADAIASAQPVAAAPAFWYNPENVVRTRLTDYADQIEITGFSVKFGHATTPLYAAPAAPSSVADLTAAQIEAGADVLSDDTGKPIGRDVAIMVADAMRAAAPAAPVAQVAPPVAADDARHREIGAAVERACRDLPDGFELDLELENGSGNVRLYDGGFQHGPGEFEGDTFAEKINAAIDAATSAQHADAAGSNGGAA